MGNSHYPFARLIEKMDEIAPSLPQPVSMQLGCARNRPRNLAWDGFLPFGEMMERIAGARLLIGHASAGPILYARKFRIPLILVPRRPELNEHVDGHQVETGKAVENLPGVRVVWDMGDLRPAILSILDGTADLTDGRTPSRGSADLVAAIRSFVDDVAAGKRR